MAVSNICSDLYPGSDSYQQQAQWRSVKWRQRVADLPRKAPEPPLICGSGICGTLCTNAKILVCFSAKAVSSVRSLCIPLRKTYCSYKLSSRLLGMLKKIYSLFFYLLQTVP